MKAANPGFFGRSGSQSFPFVRCAPFFNWANSRTLRRKSLSFELAAYTRSTARAVTSLGRVTASSALLSWRSVDRRVFNGWLALSAAERDEFEKVVREYNAASSTQQRELRESSNDCVMKMQTGPLWGRVDVRVAVDSLRGFLHRASSASKSACFAGRSAWGRRADRKSVV